MKVIPWHSVAQLFRPSTRTNDEDLKYITRLVTTTLRATIIGASLFAVLVPFLYADLQRLGIVLPLIVLALAVQLLIRCNFLYLASHLLVLIIWGAMMIAAVTGGGVGSPAYSSLMVAILIAGLLLGRNALIGMIALSIAAGGAMIYAESNHLLPLPKFVYTSLIMWVAQALIFGVGGLLLYLALERLTEARDLARCNAHTLGQALDKMHHEMARRREVERDLQFQADILAQIHDAVIVADENQMITYWNHAAEQLYGLERSSVLGKKSDTLFGYQEQDDTKPLIESLRADGFWQGELYTTIHEIGQTVQVEAKVKLMKSPVTGRTQAIVSAHNIAARKQAESALETRIQELSTLQQASLRLTESLDMHAVGQRVIEVLEQLMPYYRMAIVVVDDATKRPRLIAHSAMRLDPEKFAVEFSRVSKLIQAGQGVVNRVVQTGQLVRLGRTSDVPDYVVGDPDMQSELCIPLQASGCTIGALNVESPQPNAFGEHDERLLTTLAVQVAQTIENARLYEQAQYRADLLQNVSDAIIATDMNFTIQNWNRAAEEIYGWSTEEACGESIKVLVPTCYPHDQGEDVLTQFMENGSWQGEVVQQDKEGKVIHILSSVTMLFDPNGQPTGAVAVNRDVTQQHRTAQALRESERRYRDLADQLRILHQIDQHLLADQSSSELSGTLLVLLSRLADCQSSSVVLIDQNIGDGILLATQAEDPSVRPGDVILANHFPHLDDIGQGEVVIVKSSDDFGSTLPKGAVQTSESIRHCVVAPLMARRNLIGVLNLFYEEAEVAAVANIDLIQTAAASLAMWLANRELYDQIRTHAAELEQRVGERTGELQEQYRRQAGLARIELAVNQPHEMQPLLDQIVSVGTETLPASNGMAIVLWDDQREEFTSGSSTVPGQQDLLPSLRIRRSGGATRWIIEHEEPLVVPDVACDPIGVNRLIDEFGTRAYVGVPLLADDKAMGVLYAMERTPRQYSEDDISFLTAIARRASLAITKVRLFEQAQGLAAQEERQRLSRDLHDVISQSLFSLSVTAETLPLFWEKDPELVRSHLTKLHLMARGTLAEMRSLLLELRPDALTQTDLDILLRQLVEAFTGRKQIPVTLSVQGGVRLPPNVQNAFYRVAQESLNNSARHAHASSVSVTLQKSIEQVKMTISDDGRGFQVDQISPERLGIGIMHERAQEIGSSLQICSEVDKGTTVTLFWSNGKEICNESLSETTRVAG